MPLLICSDGVANWVIWKVLTACCWDEEALCSSFPVPRHQAHTLRFTAGRSQLPPWLICAVWVCKDAREVLLPTSRGFPLDVEILKPQGVIACWGSPSWPGRECCLWEGEGFFHHPSGFPGFSHDFSQWGMHIAWILHTRQIFVTPQKSLSRLGLCQMHLPGKSVFQALDKFLPPYVPMAELAMTTVSIWWYSSYISLNWIKSPSFSSLFPRFFSITILIWFHLTRWNCFRWLFFFSCFHQ